MAEQKYDCDERGYPVDPDHPWNKPSPPNDRRASLARRFARRMTALQRAWEIGGNPLAIAEAVKLCHEFQQPPWQWIAEAVSGFVDDRITEAEKRRLRETAKHLTRYDLVQELVERREEFMENKDDRASTWEKRYAAVSKILEGTDAAGDEETIRNSYKIVARRFRVADPDLG